MSGLKKNTKSSSVSDSSTETVRSNYHAEREAPDRSAEFVKGQIYEAVVNNGNPKKIFIEVAGKACKCFLKREYVRVELNDGDRVKVSYLYTDDYGKNCFKYEGKV